jgi:hypothetical protein
MRRFLKYLFTFAFLLFCIPGFAQQKTYKSELGFNSENDAYLATGQDRYYTNGLFINFRSVAKEVDPLKYRKKIWSITAGQTLFNAQSGAVPNENYVDRPFAAYLYGGVSMHYFGKGENSTKISLQMGTIGPAALGKPTQELIHNTFGFYDINGWQFQVKNEIGVNINLQSHVFLYRSKNKNIDFSMPIEARIGNTFSGLKSGVLLRIGTLNPFYHSVATNSNIATQQESGLQKKEFYFFLKPSLDLVLYDATIKGGYFITDKGPITYQSQPVVFAQQVGLAYANQRWTLDFSAIFKTKELKEMLQSNQYGSLNIYYRF